MGKLTGHKVAVLSESGFEEVELTEPLRRLRESGAEVHIISPSPGVIKGWNKDHWSIEVAVDKPLHEAHASDYRALVLPGGVLNPDQLRVHTEAIHFVQAFFKAGKPVAAICHGPQLLIDAEVVSGRKMTSVRNISKDLLNAGAEWVDEEVVVDQGLVTSRTPKDLPAFLDKMIEEFAEGLHVGQTA